MKETEVQLDTPAYSVSEFTKKVKGLLENGLRPCWVRGEVSNLRAQASGHVYFSLKDAGAQLSAVMFRGDAMRQSLRLRDGMQVVVFGEISVYEARGQYQLIVRVAVEDGVGRLQREFEALKQQLLAEGLFEPDKKRQIPTLPKTVGFVTSPTGAAVQDFCRILIRRGWRGQVVILPCKVQGEGAADEMVRMLKSLPDLPVKLDLLVIGRGGGSLEDLWAFNEESLVRAVAACPVPTISAVGHEIDFTLCDFASDVRAETPSAAAELISSEFIAALERVEQWRDAMENATERALDQWKGRLEHARSQYRLLSPSSQLERNFLRADDVRNRLAHIFEQACSSRKWALSERMGKFRRFSPEGRIMMARQRLEASRKRLKAASPESVLNRGYAILRDESGTPLMRRNALHKDQVITAQLADGDSRLRVENP